jgi:hypothetical protein
MGNSLKIRSPEAEIYVRFQSYALSLGHPLSKHIMKESINLSEHQHELNVWMFFPLHFSENPLYLHKWPAACHF